MQSKQSIASRTCFPPANFGERSLQHLVTPSASCSCVIPYFLHIFSCIFLSPRLHSFLNCFIKSSISFICDRRSFLSCVIMSICLSMLSISHIFSPILSRRIYSTGRGSAARLSPSFSSSVGAVSLFGASSVSVIFIPELFTPSPPSGGSRPSFRY